MPIKKLYQVYMYTSADQYESEGFSWPIESLKYNMYVFCRYHVYDGGH